MYEFVILAILMRAPAHGYLIAKIFNESMGPHAKVSYGRLYPLLSKLEKGELINVADTSNSGQANSNQLRSFQITDLGRERFYELMMQTDEGKGDYQQLFRFKITAFNYIKNDERLYLIDQYLNYCQDTLSHLKTLIHDLTQKTGTFHFHNFPTEFEYLEELLRHVHVQWEIESKWLKRLRKRITAG